MRETNYPDFKKTVSLSTFSFADNAILENLTLSIPLKINFGLRSYQNVVNFKNFLESMPPDPPS